jgi:prevent-host-death family protein
MTTVGIRQLRDHLSDYLRRVREGEHLRITDRGEPIGDLVPADSSAAAIRAQELVRQGRARWNGGKPRGLKSAPRPRAGTVGDAVIEDRG